MTDTLDNLKQRAKALGYHWFEDDDTFYFTFDSNKVTGADWTFSGCTYQADDLQAAEDLISAEEGRQACDWQRGHHYCANGIEQVEGHPVTNSGLPCPQCQGTGKRLPGDTVVKVGEVYERLP